MSTSRWTLLAAAGAAFNGLSAIFVSLANVAESTAAVYRCLYALPILAAMHYIERRMRRTAPIRPTTTTRHIWVLRIVCGLFLALDLVLWNFAIVYVGAGIATVLVNVQVLVVGLLGWLLGEPPSRRLLVMTPVVFGGLVLVSGAVGTRSYGVDPLTGVWFGLAAAVAYAGYLMTLRRATHNNGGAVVGPMFGITAATAAWCLVLGALIGDMRLVPSWPAHGWLVLLALCVQIAGWLLIALSLRHLPVVVISFILLIQPTVAMGAGVVFLGEQPSPYQLIGVIMMLAAIGYVTRGPQRRSGSDTASSRVPTDDDNNRARTLESQRRADTAS